MSIRAVATISAIFLMAIMILRYVPISWRSTQADILGGNDYAIKVFRPRYIIPREFHSEGGMNPVNFWSFSPDPNYIAGKLSKHHFNNLKGDSQGMETQGFAKNHTFRNPRLREEILAIRVDGRVYDFSVPEFIFWGVSKSAGFRLIAQYGTELFFFYHAVDVGRTQRASAIIHITMPFEAKKIEITSSDKTDKWIGIVARLRNIGLNDKVFTELCGDRFVNSVELAGQLFEMKCP